MRSYSTLVRREARRAPPPGSPNITKRDAGTILCVRRPSCGVQWLSSSLYSAHLPRDIADMIDQGRLVPSFLSHLKIIMCTGIIFTVHKHSEYCNYGLAILQEKNTFLLPILVPDIWLKWLRQFACAPCVLSSIMRLEWLERYTREMVSHWYGAAAP